MGGDLMSHASSSAAAATSWRRTQVLSQQLIQPAPCSAKIEKPIASSSSQQLFGQVAIITGAGKGIGEAAAKLLSSQGASVVLCDLDEEAVKSVASQIQSNGGQAVALKADVTDETSARQIVEAAVKAFGPSIHILVNNAGFTWDAVIHKTNDRMFQTMLDVHCVAPFRLIREAVPFMRDAAKKEIEREGRAVPRCIINISSTSGTHGSAGQANYSTAKAGIVGLTKTVAKEWGPFNIRCNALAFGLIDTRLTQSKGREEIKLADGAVVQLGIRKDATSPYSEGGIKASIPLQRAGTVEDAAGAIMLLCSPWSSYITGQVMEVNGGLFM